MPGGLRDIIVGQFRQPRGFPGRIVGWVMAARGSNRRRSAWTVELLDIRPGDRVLEIGCGPGVALAAVAARGARAVVGLDHSAVMLAQAARRNRRAIAAGQVELRLGGLEALPTCGGAFDKIFSVNVILFLADKAEFYRALAAALAPGGIAATTYQPRHRNPTRADALAMAEAIAVDMKTAGFAGIAIEELALEPAPAICVRGQKPRAP
jgi:cyclopropane fatty-acyl-phospholipid synthase-like methyltransferase